MLDSISRHFHLFAQNGPIRGCFALGLRYELARDVCTDGHGWSKLNALTNDEVLTQDVRPTSLLILRRWISIRC
jgi:hypothetical protein